MAYNSMFTGEQIDAAISGINATAEYIDSVVAIKAPESSVKLTFISPSDFKSTDTYTLNGRKIELFDLNNNPIEDGWKKGVPIELTLNGDKAFFKIGGSGKNDTLPPLLGNMTVEVVEGEVNDTYTVKMDKLILDKTTEMVGGAQLEWGEEMPAKPGKGTGGIKIWTREEIITTGKPYDGLYLGDVTPSDAVTETLLWLPENDNGKIKLVPFIVLGERYDGITCAEVYVRFPTAWDSSSSHDYEGSNIDTYYTGTYLNSVLHESVVSQLIEAEITVRTRGSSGNTTKTIKRKAFTLSRDEYGLESDSHAKEGEPFTYFSSAERRKASQEGKTVEAYHTRTLFYNSDGTCWSIDQNGNGTGSNVVSAVYPSRATIVLPKDFKIQQRPDGSYTVWNEQGLMTLASISASTETAEVLVNAAEDVKDGGQILSPMVYAASKYSEVDGALLVRKNALAQSGMNSLDYAESSVNTFVDEWITAEAASALYTPSALKKSLQELALSVTITYREVGYNNAEYYQTASKKGFILSREDYGGNTWSQRTGEQIPYYSVASNRVAKYNGSAIEYYTRDASGYASSNRSTFSTVYVDGTFGNIIYTTTKGIVPAFMLPLDTPIRALADGTYDLVPEDPALVQSVSTMAETSGTPIQLKDIPVSTAGNKVTVKIPETGGEQEYITLRENYDGVSGGYALMRNNTAPGARFHATPDGGDKPYQNSELDTHVQNFADYLNESVRKYLVEGSVLIGVSGSQVTLKRSIFLPSVKEVGYTFVSVYPEGTPFEYFNSDNSRKSDNDYWTRSKNMSSGSGNANYISLSQGGLESASQTSIKPIRPIILVSGEAWFIDNGDGTYTFVGDEPASSEFVSHTVTVPHGQKVVFRQFTQNQKKQFQTMLVGGVYPPVGEVEEPFALPEFTGNHAIFGDETAGRIELYESGDLTLYPGTYDFFLVGGGSGSSYDFNDYNNSSSSTGTSGGGAGYTLTIKDYSISSSYPIPVIVGGPSVSSAKLPEGSELPRTTFAGNPTSIALADKTYVAEGGKVTRNGTGSNRMANYGYDGGSGGSSKNAGPGGSDGSNGSGSTGGLGQGTTTRAFGDPDGTLYAGGGGGHNTLGGPGGGGNGATTTTESVGTPGTPNTGGGAGGSYRRFGGMAAVAAGGSGIVIVRWNNA